MFAVARRADDIGAQRSIYSRPGDEKPVIYGHLANGIAHATIIMMGASV